MKFLEPDRLWLLVCLPIILLLFIRSWTSFSKFVNSPKANCFLFRSNLPNQWMRIMGGLMFVLAMASVIVGLAKPYYLVPVSKKEYLNVRIIFLLDVSLSMNFAEDVSPNRLAASKEWIADFYKSLDESGYNRDVRINPISQKGLSILNELAEFDNPTISSSAVQ